MISVVIPTLNAEARLGECLASLVPAAVLGIIREVIVVDGGSSDRSPQIAEAAGARILTSDPGRGRQLAVGAKAARSDWMLFLHADTVVEPSWIDETDNFLKDDQRFGVFTLRFDSAQMKAKLVAAGAMVRTRLFSMPYGDQALLISRSLYDAVGGYGPQGLFEDVDIIERLVRHKGPKALHVFKTCVVTSAEKYEQNGYARQVIDNLWRLVRYKTGMSPALLEREYSS
ncbi:MAG: TIGR04283 family arsenosugar biosynthesis glycosyltransferase [Pseudomonadota bacterium]